MDEVEIKVLGILSDEAAYTTDELKDHLIGEEEIESALESLLDKAYIVTGDQDAWMISDKGLDVFNEQVERDT